MSATPSAPTRITHLVGHRAWQGEPGRTSEVCNPATGEVTGTLDLASAETERDDAEQRIGQPFRHAQALADAEKDLARIETQLAAMQEDIDHAAQPEPAPGNPPNGLNVETVRAHRPALGVRPNPERTPVSSRAGSSAQSWARETPARGF